ncbi:MAG: 3-dehydroquinate synthase [Pseudoalteromonas tetraodonis]|jgi:3-dehydroquinate synthase
MIERPIQLEYNHRILFTQGAFELENLTMVDLLVSGDRVPRILVAVDAGVAGGNPELLDQIRVYFAENSERLELAGDPLVIEGGEPCKNDWGRVPAIWSEINDRELDRHSYVIAIGGGAFLDLLGFASATAHRGIRHVRMPTTTLSQGDGGVGVKNGVNFFGKKNWVGTFSVPHAVVNDLVFLKTLPERERRAGVIEAIKVALIRDVDFFNAMEEGRADLGALEASALEMVIRRSAALHVEHIATGGDPFELGSARPLDFGHWAAHKLEQISDFAIGHGEAVAIGIAIDLLYAVEADLLSAEDCARILDLIEGVGFKLFSPHLMTRNGDGELFILRGLEEFREHLGGELTITLVTAPGESIEVHEMDAAKVVVALERLQERALVSG